MGLFSRSAGNAPEPASVISTATLARLPEVGRTIFGTPPAYVDVSDFYLPGFQAAGFPTSGAAWDAFVERFITDLTAGAANIGGWAEAGAFHVARDFVKSEDWAKPSLVALMDRGLRFLISVGTDRSSIPNFALRRFDELGGGHT